jgi:hypothetical protein
MNILTFFSCRFLLAVAVLIGSGLVFGGEIHEAAVNGDLEKVKALLKANPDLVSSKDESGRTALHRAVLFGNKGMVELLLANKIEVGAKDIYGRTALDIAVTRGYADVILLLRQQAQQETTNTVATTPAKPATTNSVATAPVKPATTNTVSTITSKPDVPSDSTPPVAPKTDDSKKGKTSLKGTPDKASSTSNFGRLPVRPSRQKDESELLR